MAGIGLQFDDAEVRLSSFTALLGDVLNSVGREQESSLRAEDRVLLNASYDVTREFYKEFNPAFATYWKQKTGQTVKIDVRRMDTRQSVNVWKLRSGDRIFIHTAGALPPLIWLPSALI